VTSSTSFFVLKYIANWSIKFNLELCAAETNVLNVKQAFIFSLWVHREFNQLREWLEGRGCSNFKIPLPARTGSLTLTEIILLQSFNKDSTCFII
jgi:hypothetical protein